MGGVGQFPLQGKAQAVFLRQSPKVIPGCFSTDSGGCSFVQAALSPCLAICTPPRLPHTPWGAQHPGAAPCLTGAPCTRVHRCMGEAEQHKCTQNLGLPSAWPASPLNPRGASAAVAFPKPVATYHHPYGFTRDLQPAPARTGLAPARARTQFPD